MLKECRLAMQVTDAEYDPELCMLMKAGAQDLQIAGVVLPGTVSFAETDDGMADYSTMKDPLAMRAILTYVRMHFESPADYDRLAESYALQKVQLMHAGRYTDYGDGDAE